MQIQIIPQSTPNDNSDIYGENMQIIYVDNVSTAGKFSVDTLL